MGVEYTVRADQLAETDVYTIEPVSSLKQFLKDGHPLCLVHHPQWKNSNAVEMIRITGKDQLGKPDWLYLVDAVDDHGRTKGYLDRNLLSPYLFISWRSLRGHLFRLCRQHEILDEFPDFESALDAFLSNGFTPEKSYRRKHTVFELWCLSMRRRYLLKELVSVLSAR